MPNRAWTRIDGVPSVGGHNTSGPPDELDQGVHDAQADHRLAAAIGAASLALTACGGVDLPAAEAGAMTIPPAP